MATTRIDTLLQYTDNSNLTWDMDNEPVILGALVIDVVNKIIKKGDGVGTFSSLPVWLDYDFISTPSITQLASGDLDDIVISTSDTYTPSGVTLSSILDQLDAIGATHVNNSNRYIIVSNADQAIIDVSGATDNTMVEGINGDYTPGSMTIADFIAALVSNYHTGAISHIYDLVWYTDSTLTTLVDDQNDTGIDDRLVYYCKVFGFHDSKELHELTFTLATTNNNITIIREVSSPDNIPNVFRVEVGEVGDTTITFTASVNDGTAIVSKDMTVVFLERFIGVMVSVYGGTGIDLFFGVVTDSSGNIICAGLTDSEVAGNNDALVVKFDTNLNILASKVYGGIGSDIFHEVATDANDNIICVGVTSSEGSGIDDTLVVKFDTNLDILTKKIYGGSGIDRFRRVATDSNDNIICVGYTTSEGSGGNDALVIKFDPNLNILARKIYGGTGTDEFRGVTTDSNNNITCVGWTSSEGADSDVALVVKYDPNLDIIAKKIYDGSGADLFFGVVTDSSGNIICAGQTTSEGSGDWDTLVVKFDPNLNILAKKIYGGTGTDEFRGVTTDSNNNITCVGWTSSEGAGNYDALVVKLSSDIPTGTFVGTVLTNLTLTDSNLTLADSNLTLADSNLTLANSNLTLANSNLTLADSNLTQESDNILL